MPNTGRVKLSTSGFVSVRCLNYIVPLPPNEFLPPREIIYPEKNRPITVDTIIRHIMVDGRNRIIEGTSMKTDMHISWVPT